MRAGRPDIEIHQLATEALAQADGLLLGRVTYELMEQSWRPPASDAFPDWMRMRPFARTIHEIPKYVASTTLEGVDWNAELLGGDVREAVRKLKSRPGGPLRLGGSTLATDVAGWGLVDQYEFTVHLWVAGHGPYLLAGLPRPLDLTPTAATSPPAPSRRRTACRPERLRQLRPHGPRQGGAGRHRAKPQLTRCPRMYVNARNLAFLEQSTSSSRGSP